MSFIGYEDIIKEGDTVILYINPTKMFAIEVKRKITDRNNDIRDNIFQTVYGSLKVETLIGKRFGTKVMLSRGWAYVLHPTPELWTSLLPHRTQIVYTPDISMIIFQLDLKSGSVILEAGTGSGSLTHALARTVYPNGHVYTFEFHQGRQEKAVVEFREHGLSDVVTVTLRNVCGNGYGDEMLQKADAVFLDLPSPWEAVPYATDCFKTAGGRIGSFSPCIEQAQRTCEVLRDSKYEDIITLECIQKEFSVVERSAQHLSLNWGEELVTEKFLTSIPVSSEQIPGHTGFLTFATFPPKRRPFESTPIARTEPAPQPNGNSILESESVEEISMSISNSD